MGVDYKKELESAAKSMILVHEPDVLIKLIARSVVQKVHVSHVGILLQQSHEKKTDTYVLTVSRGTRGVKIPAGYARMDMDNPLIRFFTEKTYRKYLNHGALVYEQAKEIIQSETIVDQQMKVLLEQVLYQLEIYDLNVCIPSYFRDEMLGLLLLGKKESKESFTQEELDFFTALAYDVAMAIRNARLFKQIEQELTKRQQLFINTTVALATAIEAKDHYTHGHTERVTQISLEIAEEMKKNYININDKFLEDLRIAALLHDIGKIGVPESILNKEGPLTQEEWEKMKVHPVIGASILAPITELEYAILGVKYHHERFDGKGYPEGLTNGNIPMNAAIISVADSYDAMTSNRPYRKAKERNEAVDEIQKLSGAQFHPQVVAAFLRLVQVNKI